MSRFLLGMPFNPSSGYAIQNSTTLDGSTDYFAYTPASAGSRTTWTQSFWVKDAIQSAERTFFLNNATTSSTQSIFRVDTNQYTLGQHNGTNWDWSLDVDERSHPAGTARKFLDPSAWMHVVLTYASAAVVSRERIKLWINGVQRPLAEHGSNGMVSGDGFPSASFAGGIGIVSEEHRIARHGSYYGSGYLAEFIYIDGTAYPATKFGEFDDDGLWVPINPSDQSLTFGTNGTWLDFSSSTGLGLDKNSSSNSAAATASNGTSTWNGSTGSFTFSGDDILGSVSNAGMRTDKEYRGDFTYVATFADNDGSDNNRIMGFYDYSENSTFASGSGHCGMSSMTNSWWIDTEPSSNSISINYGSTEGITKSGTGTTYDGKVLKFTRTGTVITVHLDTTLVHTYTQACTAGAVKFAHGGNNSGDTATNVSWTAIDAVNSYEVKGTPVQVTDAPSDSGSTIGNYATLNPIKFASYLDLQNGNLGYRSTSGGGIATSNIMMSSGKWYWEVTVKNTAVKRIGIVDDTMAAFPTGGYGLASPVANVGDARYLLSTNGYKGDNDGTAVSYGDSYTTNDVIMVALDVDNGKIWWGEDGTWHASGVPDTGTNAAYTDLAGSNWFAAIDGSSGTPVDMFNFGQTAFAHPIGASNDTEGFKPLNTANLPEPAIKKSSDHFLPMTYIGTGSGQRVGKHVPFTDSHTISYSALFDGTDYLTRTNDTTQENTKRFTFSTWIKRSHVLNGTQNGLLSGGSGTTAGRSDLIFTSGATTGESPDTNYDSLKFDIYTGSWTQIRSLIKLNDVSKWYHVVLVYDAANGTAADTLIIYVDGVRQTLDSASGVPNNLSLINANGQATRVGADASATAVEYEGYMAETIMCDGYGLDASVFGQTDSTTGRWIPKEVTAATLNTAADAKYGGSNTSGFGNNGFHLAYGTTSGSDSALGDDTSGEGNDFTITSGFDDDKARMMYDTPTRNFCVFNTPYTFNAMNTTIGNLTVQAYTGSDDSGVPGTLVIPSSGKYYWEYKIIAMTNSSYKFAFQGICNNKNNLAGSGGAQADIDAWGYYHDGTTSNHVSRFTYAAWQSVSGYARESIYTTTNESSVTDFTPTYQVAVDMDNGFLYFGRENTWQNSGDPTSGATGTGGIKIDTAKPWLPFYFNDAGSIRGTVSNNWGQWLYYDSAALALDSNAGGYFRYTAPSEYKALNEDNLPTSTVGLTDLVWIKNRDQDESPVLVDSVRGVYNYLEPDDTTVETADATTIQQFLQQGFQIGNMEAVNTKGESYIAWCWKAGGAPTATNVAGAGATPTAGSVKIDGSNLGSALAGTIPARKLSANTTSGFSIIRWSGNVTDGTIAHGLGSNAPKFWMVKNTGTTNGWNVGHQSIANTSFLALHVNDAVDTSGAAIWDSTYPGTDVISIGDNAGVNGTGTDNMICYAWAEVEGFSKFGTYLGGGVNDAFVNTGFRPALVIIKNTAASQSWVMKDTTRNPYNPATRSLQADLYNDETPDTDGNDNDININSNGFEVTENHSGTNSSGVKYVYCAWAEAPFGGSGSAQGRGR